MLLAGARRARRPGTAHLPGQRPIMLLRTTPVWPLC
ncbi:MAG: hypothetical protein QOK19_2628, partial [Solirubrobacteraceae bacterium]|nr:hypothetical protein [Solirubrobacteraceae bacterium]